MTKWFCPLIIVFILLIDLYIEYNIHLFNLYVVKDKNYEK